MIFVTRSLLNVCLISRFGLFSMRLGLFNAILFDFSGLRSFFLHFVQSHDHETILLSNSNTLQLKSSCPLPYFSYIEHTIKLNLP